MRMTKTPVKGFKERLPTKICPVCGLQFSWRKRWRLNWDRVVYCSERCRRSSAHQR
jgi:hypothetical protein